MAWGRKKSSGRKEPRFGIAAALADLRLDPKDRIPAAGDAKPKKATKRKVADDDDEEPPVERKPRESRNGKRRGKSSGLSIGRMVYWCAVLGL